MDYNGTAYDKLQDERLEMLKKLLASLKLDCTEDPENPEHDKVILSYIDPETNEIKKTEATLSIDRVLTSAYFDDEYNFLHLEFNCYEKDPETGEPIKKDLVIPFPGLTFAYKKGDGIFISEPAIIDPEDPDAKYKNKTISLQINQEAEDSQFINLTSGGLGLSGITTAFTNADNNLRSELTNAYIAADNEIISAYQEADEQLRTELTEAYTEKDSELSNKIDKLSDKVNELNGISGVQRDGNKFFIQLNESEDNHYINLTADGLGLSGITTAFTDADNKIKNEIAELSGNLNNLTGVSGVQRKDNEFFINVASLKSNKDNKFINLTSGGLGLSGITDAFTNADNKLHDEFTEADTKLSNKIDNIITNYQAADTQLSGEISNLDGKISGLTERTLTRDRWLHDKITGSFDTLDNKIKNEIAKLSVNLNNLTGVKGVQREGNEFFISVADSTINDNKFINLTSNGLGLSGITTFVNSVSSNIVTGYQAKDVTLSSNLIDVISNVSGTITSNYQAKDTDLENKIANISGKISGNLNLVNILDENSDINYYAKYQLKYGDTPIGTTIDIPKDQFLKSATYIPAEEVLRLTFQLNVEGDETNSVDIPVGDLIDEYSEGNGITITDNIEGKNIVSINVAPSGTNDNKFIDLTSEGLGLSGITDFVNSVSSNLVTGYQAADTTLNDKIVSAFTKADETLSNNLLKTISGLDSRFTLSGDHNNSEYASVYTLLYDGKQIGDPINIPKDQFLKSAEYIPAEEVLRFEFALSNNNSKTLDIPVGALIDEYSEGNGITITDNIEGKNIVSFKVASSESEDNKFINLTSEGLGLSGITDAFTTADNNLRDELTKVNEVLSAKIDNIITDYQAAYTTLNANIDNLIANDIFLSGTLETVSSNYKDADNNLSAAFTDADNQLSAAVTGYVDDKVNELNGISGVLRDGNKFFIQLNESEDNHYINLTSGGLGLFGITTFVNSVSGQLQTNINTVENEYQEADKELSNAYKAADETLREQLTDYIINKVNALTGISGVQRDGNEFSIKVSDQTINDNKFINLTSDGLGLSGITSAFTDADNNLRAEFTNANTKLNDQLTGYIKTVSGNIVSAYQSADNDIKNEIDELSVNLNNLTGVSGVHRDDNKFSIIVSDKTINDNKFINLTSGGLGLSGITTFVNSVSEQLQTNINTVETAYKAADETLRGQLTDYVKDQFDALTGVNGITYNNNNKQISIKVADPSETNDNKFINLTSDGLGLFGITTAYKDADTELNKQLTGYIKTVSGNIVSAYQSADNTLSSTLSAAVIGYVKNQFDALTGVNGITYNNKQISINVADSGTNDNKFINLTDSGLGLAGITDFVNSVSSNIVTGYQKADNNLNTELTNAYKEADNTLSSTLSAAVTEYVNEQKFLKEIEVSGAEALSITEKANNEQTISLAISNQPGNAIVDAASGLFVQGYKAGVNIKFEPDSEGFLTINGSNDYVLPCATFEELGGIKSGKDIEIDADGFVTVLSAACVKNSLTIGDKVFDGTTSAKLDVTSSIFDFELDKIKSTSGNLITVRCC